MINRLTNNLLNVLGTYPTDGIGLLIKRFYFARRLVGLYHCFYITRRNTWLTFLHFSLTPSTTSIQTRGLFLHGVAIDQSLKIYSGGLGFLAGSACGKRLRTQAKLYRHRHPVEVRIL